jgi:hypothetical protein
MVWSNSRRVAALLAGAVLFAPLPRAALPFFALRPRLELRLASVFFVAMIVKYAPIQAHE